MDARDVFKIKCLVCDRFIPVKDGKFIEHRTGKGKKKPYCAMSGRRAMRQE